MCTTTATRSEEAVGDLKQYAAQIEALARRLGLDYYPVDFELVPNNFMMEIAVYGLPVRMPHWSCVRYIHQLIRQGMGRLAHLRSDVSGRSVPRLSRQRQHPAGKHPR